MGKNKLNILLKKLKKNKHNKKMNEKIKTENKINRKKRE
jgi:hypothetical protein